MVQTRAQKKLADAAAAAQAASATPAISARRNNNRKRAAAAARARTRAQHLGAMQTGMQTPAGRRAFQGSSQSKNIASSSKVNTPLRRTRARFAEPVFIPDRDSESESSLDYSQPIPSSSTSSQQEQQPGSTSSSSSSSFPSLPSPPANTNSTIPTEPTGFGKGWVQLGSDLRRESILPPALLAQFQARQQASIAQRAEEAYHHHTKEMMRQHDLTYQWYDRMMTEGLQNENQATTGGGASAPEIIDDAMTDVGSNDSEEIRDSNMEDGDGSGDSNMENGENIATYTEGDTGDVKRSVRFSPRRLTVPKTKQYQPCPPGVQYSLHSTPTLILPSCDDH